MSQLNQALRSSTLKTYRIKMCICNYVFYWSLVVSLHQRECWHCCSLWQGINPKYEWLALAHSPITTIWKYFTFSSAVEHLYWSNMIRVSEFTCSDSGGCIRQLFLLLCFFQWLERVCRTFRKIWRSIIASWMNIARDGKKIHFKMSCEMLMWSSFEWVSNFFFPSLYLKYKIIKN